MNIAKPFEEVQKQVADLVKDKILIGHAVHHDLKVRQIGMQHIIHYFMGF